jgi:hypothetical protein
MEVTALHSTHILYILLRAYQDGSAAALPWLVDLTLYLHTNRQTTVCEPGRWKDGAGYLGMYCA